MDTTKFKLILTEIDIPNTGFLTNNSDFSASNFAILGGIVIAIILGILAFISHCKKMKFGNNTPRKTRSSKFAFAKMFSFFALIAVLTTAITISSFASFSPDNENLVPVIAGGEIEITEELSANEYIYVKDTITMPEATPDGYELYAYAKRNVSPDLNSISGKIPAIEEAGELSPNSWGLTAEFEEKDSTWLPLSSELTLVKTYDVYTPENHTTDVYYGIRTDENTALGEYNTEISYIAAPTELELSTFQNFKPEYCSFMEPETQHIIRDSRDDKEYTISRLADGNCWMTQNLDLDLSTEVALTSDDTDLNSKNSWTPKNNTVFQDSSHWNCDSDEECANTTHSLDPGDEIPNPTGQGTIKPGNYYSWFAATANSGTSSMHSGEIAPDSICPKGWHMPDKDSLINLSSIYSSKNNVNLLGEPTNFVFGSYDAYLEVYRYIYLTNESNGKKGSRHFDFYAASEPTPSIITDNNNGVGGAIRCIANINSYVVKYDANTDDEVSDLPENETSNTETIQISSLNPTREDYSFLGWSLNSASDIADIQAGSAYRASSGETTFYAIWTEKVGDIIHLQDFTPEFCENMSTNVQYALADSRDGKNYSIAKLADGRCWMTQELDLDLSTETTLTSEDTDLNSKTEWTPLTDTETEIGTDWRCDSDENCALNTHSIKSPYLQHTNQYSWYAATAGSVKYSESNTTAKDSICPKNWHLPNLAEIRDWINLGIGHSDMLVAPNYIKLDGQYNGYDKWTGVRYEETLYYETDSYFWGSNYVGDNLAMSLWTTGTQAVLGDYATDSSTSANIRCVANESKTLSLSYDANLSSVQVANLPETQTYGPEIKQTHTFTIPSEKPEADGYRFLGWQYTVYPGFGIYVTHQPGDEITIAENATLKALWEKVEPLGILGADGHLEFIYTANNYHVGDTFTSSKGTTTISEIFNARQDHNWVNYSVYSINFDESFYEYKPTNMSNWFSGLRSVSSITNMQNINTSEVTNFLGLFNYTGQYADTLTLEGLGQWDTGNVTNMTSLFGFSGPENGTMTMDSLANWDTSKVTCFSTAFLYFRFVDLIHPENWDTSSATDMSVMFLDSGTSDGYYELDLSKWDVSKVVYMNDMFESIGDTYPVSYFHINIDGWKFDSLYSGFSLFGNSAKDAEFWYVEGIRNLDLSGNHEEYFDLSWMFYNAGQNANVFIMEDISGWDTSNVVGMSDMFHNAGASRYWYLDLSGWDVSRVEPSNHRDFATGVEDHVVQPIWGI